MSGGNATIKYTPTWAVASVCFVLIAFSILIEHCLHLLAKYLVRKKRRSLLHALNTIKSDLMLLGFISLLLTVLERKIVNVCIPESVGESFLPCQNTTSVEQNEPTCQNQEGKVSFMSRVGVQQLQMLIFFLAFFHVLSSFLTFSLAAAKCRRFITVESLGRPFLTMKRWEHWEAETRSLEYQFSRDPMRFRFIHQTSFGRRHLKFWSEYRLLRLPVSFLRQFFGSVYKVDYLTLRHGFIMAHFAEGSNFDFQKYLKRALEQDYEVVIGMRLWIWLFSILFIFFNANVFHSYLWLPFIPLVMLLVVGTKLEGIITKMCLDSNEKSYVIRGTLLVEPSDHLFWFARPKLLLHLIHFISFQNSFQLAFFTWSWYKFGMRSCFHRVTEDIVIKPAMGVLILVLCGYVTLPLYALVTQMGTSMRISVFPDEVVAGLKRWCAKAKRNLGRRQRDLGRRSFDWSAELSSPSFTTLDFFPSLEVDHASDDGVGPVKRLNEENVDELMQPEQQQNLGSFDGFDVSGV